MRAKGVAEVESFSARARAASADGIAGPARAAAPPMLSGRLMRAAYALGCHTKKLTLAIFRTYLRPRPAEPADGGRARAGQQRANLFLLRLPSSYANKPETLSAL
ncbi:hypothetical protein EVAR_9061_1 [Eumeta japonica]|uniref:Uncharacterized protein n=1 Tax=Eumeta variegata TaxID=151549 RepID=A0A4C1TW25_EUMVA|nr:hypothetical protein EVAR_9061_1 [Eumeta japonica]